MESKKTLWKGMCEFTTTSIGERELEGRALFRHLVDNVEIVGVGHRVVHGGETFKEPQIIDHQVEKEIEALFHLAPLHNPYNLSGIRLAKALFPKVWQCAVFDTAFHQTLPLKASTYALPKKYRELGLRKYGFHGISHQYVSEQAKEQFPSLHRIITAHIGNGVSLTAVKNGKSIETTMGFTPLDGVIMGTRCGSIDPALVLYLMEKEGLSSEKMRKILNDDSGLKGLCGESDLRNIEKKAESGDLAAQFALQIYAYKIASAIGALTVSLNGLDLLVFTGGVGENSTHVRQRILDQLSFLQFKSVVIPTNEEWQIAHLSTLCYKGL